MMSFDFFCCIFVAKSDAKCNANEFKLLIYNKIRYIWVCHGMMAKFI